MSRLKRSSPKAPKNAHSLSAKGVVKADSDSLSRHIGVGCDIGEEYD